MCDAWRNDFAAFLLDMGPRPDGTSLDRIDNDGPYSHVNCRWAIPREQSNNTRRNHQIAFRGKTQTIAQWAREIGVPMVALWIRLNRNKWTIERALTQPLRVR